MLSIICWQNIFVSSSHQAESILAAAGAIPGSGRGGCETSLCVGQNNIFDTKLVILGLKINLN